MIRGRHPRRNGRVDQHPLIEDAMFGNPNPEGTIEANTVYFAM